MIFGENIPFSNAGHICTASMSARPGKWVDIAVQTKKVGATVHARLQFAGEVIPREVVEELNDMLMANITILYSSPETALRPAPRGPLCSRMNFPLPPPPSSPYTSRTLRPPSTEEEEELVLEAWQTVFDLSTKVPLTTRCFDKYSIACACGLQKFFAERNYTVTVDELIRSPSIEDQISLLARGRHLGSWGRAIMILVLILVSFRPLFLRQNSCRDRDSPENGRSLLSFLQIPGLRKERT
jgi:hypothetical protein